MINYKHMMKKLLLILIALLPFTGKTQTFEQDLRSITMALDSARSVYLEVEVSVYTGKDGALINKTGASVLKKDKKTVTVMDNVEMYSNGTYSAVIDHENKLATIVAVNKVTDKNAFQGVDTDKLIEWMKQQQESSSYGVRKNSDTDGARSYSVTTTDGTEMTILLDMKQKSIKKVSITYSRESAQKGAHIELNYKKFLRDDDSIQINQEDYFIKKSQKFELSARLSSYKLTTIL